MSTTEGETTLDLPGPLPFVASLAEKSPAATPFTDDADEPRVIQCQCSQPDCDAEETVHAPPGRTEPWEHAVRNPRHVVTYWRGGPP
jgi:hypothetical protein